MRVGTAATGTRFQVTWSSPLVRASETGRIIAAALGLGQVSIDQRLREADAGEWQGLTPDEIEAAYPGFLADHVRPATFESVDHVVQRSVEALHAIAASADADDGAVVVITHSGVIRSLVRRLGEPDERVPNLGGVWVDVEPGRSPMNASVGLDLRGRFDPEGIVRTGVDAPGEDPGEQAHEPEAHRRAER